MSATETPDTATPEMKSDAAEAAGEPVAHLDELAEGSMKLVKADGRRICLVRTSDGVHAIDNACPHEGYGLTQGGLDGDLVTCQWHNWKFRVTDGACVQGEEAVRVHDVDVADDGAVRVTVNRPDPATLRPQLMASLRRGIERNYVGQVSRDVIRLLKAGAEPHEIIWEAVAHGAPRAEDGWGHPIAAAADCLAMTALYDGDEQALPIVQGIAGIADSERHRPINALPDPSDPGTARLETFAAAVEAEQVELAQSLLLAAIARGDTASELTAWFAAPVGAHHLSYGHGAIYTQKAFELLDQVGWERADVVLAHLVPSIVFGTREDLLPYMKPFMRELETVDLEALAAQPAADWVDDGALLAALLGSDRAAPVEAVAAALRAGAGIDRVLDVVIVAVSERMLRYDTDGEFDFDDDFGWLAITHGMTYAHAVRWLHERSVDSGRGCTPDTVRVVFFSAFLANWTGRHEWHTEVGQAAAVVLDNDLAAAGAALQREALLDGTTAHIVHEHAVKTSRAAAREALRLGNDLPLQAAARFIRAPKLERFVAANVKRSIDFLNGRTQRD